MRLLSLIQTLLLLLFFALGFSLSTCAPLPKEGEYKEEFQLTLQLQTRNSNRLGRTNSINKRKSEFAALVNESGGQIAKVDISTNPNTVSFSSVAAGSYSVEIRRFAEDYASYPEGVAPIDYGRSSGQISVDSSSSTIAVTIQLQREIVFLDSPVEGLSYSSGGNSGITNQDGLIYYFPGESINLQLGSLDLGNFDSNSFSATKKSLTPYDVMGGCGRNRRGQRHQLRAIASKSRQ